MCRNNWLFDRAHLLVDIRIVRIFHNYRLHRLPVRGFVTWTHLLVAVLVPLALSNPFVEKKSSDILASLVRLRANLLP